MYVRDISNGIPPLQPLEANMALSFSSLSASQVSFVVRVCEDLQANIDPAQVGVHGDKDGIRFAAVREGASWCVCFDFGGGDCYHTAVQLPSDWRLEYKLARRAA